MEPVEDWEASSACEYVITREYHLSTGALRANINPTFDCIPQETSQMACVWCSGMKSVEAVTDITKYGTMCIPCKLIIEVTFYVGVSVIECISAWLVCLMHVR